MKSKEDTVAILLKILVNENNLADNQLEMWYNINIKVKEIINYVWILWNISRR